MNRTRRKQQEYAGLQARYGYGCKLMAATMLGGAAWMAGAQAQAQELQPHRALYEMELDSVRGTQTVTGVSGMMAFTWQDVCGGWTMEQRSRLALDFGERGGTELGWRYNSWESDAGDRMRFFLRRFQDGEETEVLRGEARLGPEGGSAKWQAGDENGESRSLDLPADTLFPKAHTVRLIQALRDGGSGVFSHIFDGTGESDGLHVVNAVVLSDTHGEPASLESSMLEDVPSWRVTKAFFDPGEPDGAPESEQTARLFANGITDTLRIDYGDFVVKAVLSELEALERPEC